MNTWGIVGACVGAVVGGVVAYCTCGVGATTIPQTVAAGASLGMALGSATGGAADSKIQADETEAKQKKAADLTAAENDKQTRQDHRKMYKDSMADPTKTSGVMFDLRAKESLASNNHADLRDSSNRFTEDKGTGQRIAVAPQYGDPKIKSNPAASKAA